jgi:protein CpxP
MTNTELSPKNNLGIKRLAAALLVAASATLALSAWSNTAHGMGGHRGMPPMGGSGLGMEMMGPGFMGPRAFDPAHPEHLDRRVDRMLDGLGATDAQRTQIKEIVRLAAVDLKAQHDRDDGRALRDKGLQLFTAPSIDAAAVDALRQQIAARREESSKRMMQAMIDIGRVLSPEQRAKAAQLARFHSDRLHDRMKRMPEGSQDEGRSGRPPHPPVAPVAPIAPAR